MPLTPADTRTTLSDAVVEQFEDSLDTAAYYARKRPFITVAAAFVLGLLAARAFS